MSQIIYYFNSCCGNEQPFGILSGLTSTWIGFDSSVVGRTYGVVVGSFSGCVTYSGSSLTSLNGLNIKENNTVNFFLYENCQFCITNIFPCYTPPPSISPIITGYKNECGIITILPMGVVCEVSPPSSYSANDGEVSVSITGGTPPYTTTWSNGNISPAIGGLGNGSYTATTVDFWGDFTATTVCTISTEKDCTFSASIIEFFVEECFDNGMSGYTYDIT